jgi:hypothetical protein
MGPLPTGGVEREAPVQCAPSASWDTPVIQLTSLLPLPLATHGSVTMLSLVVTSGLCPALLESGLPCDQMVQCRGQELLPYFHFLSCP